MSGRTCDWIRDRLPEYAAGGLDATGVAAVTEHLQDCSECRDEAELVRRLRAPAVLPAGFEGRVVAALGTHAPRSRMWSVRHYAMAATVAFALITGSLLWRSAAGPVDIDANPGVASLPVVDGGDALLPGPGLSALSEEELLALLKEMES
jgi:anti-sigma factor RsiW